MIKLAPIKPSAKAITFTRFAVAAKLGLRDAAEAAIADFESTTATWSHSVSFVMKEQKDGYLVGTKDDVWNMLDAGTRAHLIVARRAKRLRFGVGGAPKTRPGFIGSVSGRPGSGAVFRQVVHHPGTTARAWSKLIAAKYRVQMGRYISARIKEAM